LLRSNTNGQPAKKLTIPEDRDFHVDEPLLRDETSQDIGDDDRACCLRASLGLQPNRIPAWQGDSRLGPGVDELLAVLIGDQHPRPSPCRERAARLGLERVEIIVEQCW
jgi:hypothetical protein